MYILNESDTSILNDLITDLTGLDSHNALVSYYQEHQLMLYLGLVISSRAFKEKYPDNPLYLDTSKKSISGTDVEYYSRDINKFLNLFYFSNPEQPSIIFVPTSTFNKMNDLFTKIAETTELTRLPDLEAACKIIQPKIIIARYKNTIFVVTKTAEDHRDIRNTIYALIPHFFELVSDLTPEENAIITNLINNPQSISTGIDYTALLLDFLKPLKAMRRNKDLQKLYKALSKNANEEELNLHATINTGRQRIERLMQEIHREYRHVEEKQIELQKLKLYTNKYTDEIKQQAELLLDYIQQVPVITEYTIKQSNETDIKMFIKTPVRYYDPEPLQATLTNPRWDEDMVGSLSQDLLTIIKIVLTETFIKKRYDFFTLVNADIELVYRGLHTHNIVHRIALMNNAYPHPHIARYSCLGENAPIILQHLNQSEWMEAINQIIGACYNMNFTDSTVLKEFCRNLSDVYDNIRCFQNKETGEILSFRDLKNIYKHIIYMIDITKDEYDKLEDIEMEEENESN